MTYGWKAICQRCGFQYRSTQLYLEYTGLRVCEWCLDKKHPQEYVKIYRDQQPLPWTSPEPSELDVGIDINCNTQPNIVYPRNFDMDFTIIKGTSLGPVYIHTDVTVTVICTWSIY
jgi:hypothetical protein